MHYPGRVPPREYIFIVDVSGSMHGFPINTTKTLLRNLIVNLRPVDRFNVLVFESGSYWLADESLPAVEANVSKAAAFSIVNMVAAEQTCSLP